MGRIGQGAPSDPGSRRLFEGVSKRPPFAGTGWLLDWLVSRIRVERSVVQQFADDDGHVDCVHEAVGVAIESLDKIVVEFIGEKGAD